MSMTRSTSGCNLYTPRKEWLLTRDMKELVIARRHDKKEDRVTKHTKALNGLQISNTALVQNQSAPHTTRRERSATRTDTLPRDQHRVKTNGLGRVALKEQT